MSTKRKSNQRKLKGVRKTSQKKSVIIYEQYFDNSNNIDEEENTLQSLSYDTKSQLCRVCLNEGDIPIYGDESIGDISESLTVYGGVEIQEDDDFPKYLCHDCHGQLQNAIKFRQTAQETDQLLRDTDTSLPEEDITNLILEEHSEIDDEELFKETLADTNTTYHCRACELDFESSKEYGLHMFSENHNNLKDKCPFCCRVFSCIQKHLALHKVTKTVLCKICSEKYLWPNFLRHQESHCDALPYECSKCPYRGRYSADFKIHMRKHTGERPYQCSDCPAGFISKSNLNRHMLTHKNDHNYQCSKCPKRFYTLEELNNHIKVNHGGVKEHLCNLCGKTYGYRKALMRHQLHIHKREKLRGGRTPNYLKLITESND